MLFKPYELQGECELVQKWMERVAYLQNINIFVMKQNSNSHRGNKQHAAVAQLMHTLKQINLNQSWKQQSVKFNKTRTTHMQPHIQPQNLMTEQDLDQLFNRSKEKQKVKTEIHEVVLNKDSLLHKTNRDFANTKFLRLDNDFDKLLTGIAPNYLDDKENIGASIDQGDLTSKFKKDYIIGKVIGEGAYASVRVAIYRPENKKIAIKAYEKSKIKEAVRKRTIRRQIKILQILDHPNIVKIYDVVQSNNHLNIIMQYLPGISLSHSLKQQPNHKFSESMCKNIIKQLAGALKYLHTKNIAHRDIKLENIIVSEDMKAKLIDFGFSTCIEKYTKIKIFCGTPSYMAPEIVQKLEYRGEAADIWALGVMMFVMLVGYFPYKGNSDEQLYRKINRADYPTQDITQLRKAHHLISKMFTLDPSNRITASEILLHPWMADTPLETSPSFQLQRKSSKNSAYQLKKMFNSKEKSLPKEQKDYPLKEYNAYKERRQIKELRQSKEPKDKDRDSYSKKKKTTERSYLNNLNKTHKNMSGKLSGHSNSKPNKLERTMGNPLRQEKSPSNALASRENRIKIMDFLKFQLKRCSESLSPCKSFRN